MTTFQLLQAAADANQHIRIYWGRNSGQLYVEIQDDLAKRHGLFVNDEAALQEFLGRHNQHAQTKNSG